MCHIALNLCFLAFSRLGEVQVRGRAGARLSGILGLLHLGHLEDLFGRLKGRMFALCKVHGSLGVLSIPPATASLAAARSLPCAANGGLWVYSKRGQGICVMPT